MITAIWSSCWKNCGDGEPVRGGVAKIEIEDASKLIDLLRLELRAVPLSNLILSDPAVRDAA